MQQIRSILASRRLGQAAGKSAKISLILAVGAMLELVPIAIAAPAPASPAGLWSTKDDESIIEIAPCGTYFCGTMVWMNEPNESDGTPKLDKNNPDKSLRSRPLLGMVLLIDLAPERDHWRGKAYNPEDGRTYNITFKPSAGKVPADKAEIEGCVLGFLCSSETFTRAQAVPATPAAPVTQAPSKAQSQPKGKKQ